MKDLNPLVSRAKDSSSEAQASKPGLGFVSSFLPEPVTPARTNKSSDYAFIGMALF